MLPLDPARFKWPYNGLIDNLRVAISGKANFLAALGLLALTEILGRHILLAGRPPGTRPEVEDAEAFRVFFEEYMGQPAGTGKKVYGAFRSGFAHNLEFDKANRSFVIMSPNPDFVAPGGFVPIDISPDGSIKKLDVNAYWRDWQGGLAKGASERPDLILNR